ncbi:hypothetical protein BC941DRAFT_407260 [Chlamydoabsidia padenii]|nr:hypothetical protein BC941DRAFT_407260 [Chlamydoabsidia padenii]
MDDSSTTQENDDFQDRATFTGRKQARIRPNQHEMVTRCSLCFAHWTNCGPHRIISLRCGHTFGEKCILDLIKSTGLNASCPTCRDMVRRSHLRPIWPNKVFQDDDTLLNTLKQELEQTQATLEETIRQLDDTNSQYQQCRLALKELSEDQLLVSQDQQQQQQPRNNLKPASINSADASFHLVDTNLLSNERHVTRVMAVAPEEEMVVATMKQGTHNHGLYKLSLRDLRSCEYIGNHSGLVRDVKSSTNKVDNGNVTLLSTGFDKTLKLTSASNNCTVLTYNLPLAGWSCEFNCVDTNQFYCGLSNNSILVFDIRNTKNHLHQLFDKKKTANAPIHTMISCQLDGDYQTSTLICASLTHTYQWEWIQGEQEPTYDFFPNQEKGYTPYALAFDNKYKSLMVSSRASGFSKHTVMQQSSTDGDNDEASKEWKIMWKHTNPQYQKNMTRTDLYEGLACFSDDNGAIYLRNMEGPVQTIPAEPAQQVVDTKSTHIQDRQFLISLTDNKIKLYNKRE